MNLKLTICGRGETLQVRRDLHDAALAFILRSASRLTPERTRHDHDILCAFFYIYSSDAQE